MKPITLSTQRLVLRCSEEKDSHNLFRDYFSDSYSSRFLTRKPHAHIDQTKKFLKEWCMDYWDRPSNKFAWVIALMDTDEAIGVFLVELDDLQTAKIHYGIIPGFSRQGLITEAGTAVVKWLMSHENIKKIWTVCDLLNEGSIRVLEKLGFEREGILEKSLFLL